MTGKLHSHVCRDIRTMIEQLKDDPNLDHEEFQQVTDDRGYTTEYLLTKNQTLLLMTGYSVPLRQKLINRWQELENKLQLISKKGDNNFSTGRMQDLSDSIDIFSYDGVIVTKRSQNGALNLNQNSTFC